ncbi:DUF4168 domain-containing protein [Leptolyngbya sp. PCC 6406]|uniref:DUF4168 domain-containing protein n=1 Tax=Leptolyngbya sp. PCC 6406 TaxID=1173264 RepID=UPI0002ACEE17|nr:DUF4168 domain-containing protein [Leptolyngbya sp. PCC 6406]
MVTSKLLRGSLAALLLIGFPSAGAALAQTQEPLPQQPQIQVSGGQIDLFVNAYKAIQQIQQDIQPELVAAVEAEGLTVEEFNTIAQAQQAPETAEQVPPEQVQQFAQASEQVVELQQAARADMQEAIQAEGLTLEEFDAILEAAQQDPTLRAEINQRLAED